MSEPNGTTPQGPQPIPPQPTPMTFRVFTSPIGGQVVLEFTHPAGAFIAFLDPGSCAALAEQMTQAANSARTGLTVITREQGKPIIRGEG